MGIDNVSNADDMYKKEHIDTKWDGNVGLIYPSDYVYTFGHNINSDCFNNILSCNGDNAASSWLFNNANQWTFTSSSSDNLVFRINSNGSIETDNANVSSGVRPVVYLKSNVLIAGGSGKANDPYILG